MPRSKDRIGDYHRDFSAKLIEQIKAGTAPFQQSWKPGERALPQSLRTGEPYRGGNSLRLQVEAARRGYTDSRWGTYLQIKAAGGHVKRGEKGTPIAHYGGPKVVPAKDDQGQPKLTDQGQPLYTRVWTNRNYYRIYHVFNAEQTSGLPAARRTTPAPEWKAHEQAQAIIEASGVDVRHQAGDRAFYNLRTDQVVLPEPGQFPSAGGYYQTALHELGHATGHPDRLNRDTLDKPHGSPDYAREELRAEIAAMMTGDRIGLGHEPQNGTAYVAGWVKALEDDPREIQRAAADAEKISTYLIEPTRERLEQREQTTPGESARDEDREPRQELTPAPAPQAVTTRQQPAQSDFNRNIQRAADAALDGLERHGVERREQESGERPSFDAVRRERLVRGLQAVRQAAGQNVYDRHNANFAGVQRQLQQHAYSDGLSPAHRQEAWRMADSFDNQGQSHDIRDFERLDLEKALAAERANDRPGASPRPGAAAIAPDLAAQIGDRERRWAAAATEARRSTHRIAGLTTERARDDGPTRG